MQIMIIGCGRIGAALAQVLVQAGEDVVVLDRSAERLDVLSALDCLRITGPVIDREVMREAGMETADCLFCVSDDENLNLMAGLTAREFFQVPRIIIRVYTTSHIDCFAEEGLQLICSTDTTLSQLFTCLRGEEQSNRFEIAGTELQVLSVALSDEWVGKTLAEFQLQRKKHILGVVREGQLELADPQWIFQPGDSCVVVEEDAQ